MERSTSKNFFVTQAPSLVTSLVSLCHLRTWISTLSKVPCSVSMSWMNLEFACITRASISMACATGMPLRFFPLVSCKDEGFPESTSRCHQPWAETSGISCVQTLGIKARLSSCDNQPIEGTAKGLPVVGGRQASSWARASHPLNPDGLRACLVSLGGFAAAEGFGAGTGASSKGAGMRAEESQRPFGGEALHQWKFALHAWKSGVLCTLDKAAAR